MNKQNCFLYLTAIVNHKLIFNILSIFYFLIFDISKHYCLHFYTNLTNHINSFYEESLEILMEIKFWDFIFILYIFAF